VLSVRAHFVMFGNVRLCVTFVALLSLALVTLVLAAQAGLSFCSNRVAFDARAMSGMGAMPMQHPLLVCPVVLVLVIASTLLAAVVLVLLGCDSQRASTRRHLARSLARLPLARAASVLGAFVAAAVLLMIAVDGAGVPNACTCALLAALTIGGAIGAVAGTSCAARIALGLGTRLIVAIVAAIGDRRVRAVAADRHRCSRAVVRAQRRLLAATRGLRAPPSVVR
jgi:hypothetical protein